VYRPGTGPNCAHERLPWIVGFSYVQKGGEIAGGTHNFPFKIPNLLTAQDLLTAPRGCRKRKEFRRPRDHALVLPSPITGTGDGTCRPRREPRKTPIWSGGIVYKRH
jgi:hypothetical protein